MEKQADTSKLIVYAAFAGEERRFCLRYKELEELERRTNTHAATIHKGFITYDFSVKHIWTIIELGLIGGGMSGPQTSALVLYYKENEPPFHYMALAAEILAAACSGVPTEDDKKKENGTTTESPETSPKSTQPAAH